MYIEKGEGEISDNELLALLEKSVKGKALKKVLILPPDYTRMYSGAGKITRMYYNMLKDVCEVDIMPALGTHEPMTKEECAAFFSDDVPFEKILVHDWRNGVVKIGEVPSDFVKEVSEGLVDDKIDVDNRSKAPYIDVNDPLKSLSPEEQAILDTLGSDTRLVDDVIAECGLPAGTVLATLTLLEVRGLVTRLPGKRIRAGRKKS